MSTGSMLRTVGFLAVAMILAGFAMGGSHSDSEGRAGFERGRSSAGLDSATLGCLGCHDGVIARDMGYKVGRYSVEASGSHPVGVSYAASALNNPREFTPSVQVDERVSLVEGMVSCISCHQPKAENPGAEGNQGLGLSCKATVKLTVNNTGSALCRSCHTL